MILLVASTTTTKHTQTTHYTTTKTNKRANKTKNRKERLQAKPPSGASRHLAGQRPVSYDCPPACLQARLLAGCLSCAVLGCIPTRFSNSWRRDKRTTAVSSQLSRAKAKQHSLKHSRAAISTQGARKPQAANQTKSSTHSL